MRKPLEADFYKVAKECDFNLTEACTAIAEYYEDSSENKLLASIKTLLPLVNKVIREQFPWISDSDMEDISSAAVLKYWELLKREKIRLTYPRATYAFLILVTRRTILDTRRSLQKSGSELDTTDMSKVKQVFGPLNRVHKVTWLADISMFIESFPERITKHMKDKNRFPKVTTAVIEYFITRGLADETVAEETLENNFGIKNPDFYISYLTVLFRDSLYELSNHELVTCRESEGGIGYTSSYNRVDNEGD